MAWVKSAASATGFSRTGAIVSAISNVSPMTKQSALTLPSKNFAAMSPRAGVRRGSSIAFAQEFIDRACRLAFAAFGSTGFCRWRPGVDVEMQPAVRMLDETLQEQSAGD